MKLGTYGFLALVAIISIVIGMAQLYALILAFGWPVTIVLTVVPTLAAGAQAYLTLRRAA